MTIEVKIYIYTNMRKLILLITKTKFPNLEEVQKSADVEV